MPTRSVPVRMWPDPMTTVLARGRSPTNRTGTRSPSHVPAPTLGQSNTRYCSHPRQGPTRSHSARRSPFACNYEKQSSRLERSYTVPRGVPTSTRGVPCVVTDVKRSPHDLPRVRLPVWPPIWRIRFYQWAQEGSHAW